MELGKHLRELFRLRFSAMVCIVLALVAAVSVSYKVSLSPLGLEGRPIQIASATSEVLVDTPYSTAVDLRGGRADLDTMTARATLLGNVIASAPVLDFIAQRANVPVGSIIAQPPLTPDFPRPIAKAGQERSSKDILRSPEEYRINVQVDPSVPILRVVAQAPTVKQAETLATAAIDGLNDYLDMVATTENTLDKNRIRLEVLGRSPGVVINGSVRAQASVVTFLVVFGLSAAAAVFVGRVRRGWNEGGTDPDDNDAGTPASPTRAPRERGVGVPAGEQA